jgi:hypothetical protein
VLKDPSPYELLAMDSRTGGMSSKIHGNSPRHDVLKIFARGKTEEKKVDGLGK